MKRQYRISPKGAGQPPTDAEIARYRDPQRLIYNYTKAVQRPKRPIYRDPKMFLALVLVVLLAYLMSERSLHDQPPVSDPTEQPILPAP